MSIQLIVYPQNYDGSPNPITGSTSQVIVDGINFTTVNTSLSSLNLATPTYTSAISNMTVIPINTWYRFSGDGSAVSESSGAITIGASKGIIQQLSNLSVGFDYNFTIDVGTYASTLQLQHYVGTVLIGTHSITSTGTTTIQITAQSTSDTILIYSTATNVINSMSVIPASIQPSGAIQFLGDGQVICDLYEDEDIPLSLSVDDFKNVAEKVQSYSKAFNLPGTKRNNQIFDNLFDITRSDDGVIFNPYVKTQCKLKQDGFVLFEGYLRMIDIQDKQGEISYNVNLYSEVVALADVLQDKTFDELNFDELEHAYNKTQIKYSWNDSVTPITWTNSGTSGFRDFATLKYPYVNWSNQWLIANNPGGTSGPTDLNPQLVSLEQAFRPFINIKYLIDRIFNQTGFQFTYESTFFDTADFKKLYMDFNWGGNTMPLPENQYNGLWLSTGNNGTGSFKELRLQPTSLGGLANSTVPPNYNTSTYIITATTDNEIYDISYDFKLENTNTGIAANVACRWILNNTTEINLMPTIAGTSAITYSGSFQIALQSGDTLAAQFDSTALVRQHQTLTSSVVFVQSNSTVTSATLKTLRGALGQWEFLKGIMTMFNLVSIPDESNPNHIKIEPYTDIFIPTATAGNPLADRGITHDWTDKIDVSEMKLEPLTDLNKNTIFKFVEDDDDYAFQNYKHQVQGHLYGSHKWNPGSGFTILSGEKEIVAEPFAATVIKPLAEQFSDFIVPAVYSYNSDDGTSEAFENSPRIMYNNGIKTLASCTYYIPAQNGLASENQSNILQFSHLTDIPTVAGTTIDFHFGICQLIQPIGVPVPDNLFNLYWLPYFGELYNANTRTMTIKVNLTPGDVSMFRFYDKVIIKNREFRVNQIDYKPNDLATIEFILIP